MKSGHFSLIKVCDSCDKWRSSIYAENDTNEPTVLIRCYTETVQAQTLLTGLHVGLVCKTALLQPVCQTIYGQRSFAVSGPTLWNSLPLTIRDPSMTLSQFCACLKTILFCRAYQTKHQHSAVVTVKAVKETSEGRTGNFPNPRCFTAVYQSYTSYKRPLCSSLA